MKVLKGPAVPTSVVSISAKSLTIDISGERGQALATAVLEAVRGLEVEAELIARAQATIEGNSKEVVSLPLGIPYNYNG